MISLGYYPDTNETNTTTKSTQIVMTSAISLTTVLYVMQGIVPDFFAFTQEDESSRPVSPNATG